MKSLKAKNILFSLLTILAITVTLTSCEQESVIVPAAEVTEMTAPEHPESVTEYGGVDDRNCACDVQVSDIRVGTPHSSLPQRKVLNVDTGIYTSGCTRDTFYWYTWNNPNVDIQWESGQAMSAIFTESAWVAACLVARDGSGTPCQTCEYVYVTIP